MNSDDALPTGQGSPEWRQLSFRASGLSIELEITGRGGYRRLTGRLIPRQPATVEIRTGGDVITAEADQFGRFSADAVPLGPVSLRCRLGTNAGQSAVVTGWVTLLPGYRAVTRATKRVAAMDRVLAQAARSS